MPIVPYSATPLGALSTIKYFVSSPTYTGPNGTATRAPGANATSLLLLELAVPPIVLSRVTRLRPNDDGCLEPCEAQLTTVEH